MQDSVETEVKHPMGRQQEYQRTRREDRRTSVHGVDFDDPYAWLGSDTVESMAWDEAESRLTEQYLTAWHGYEAVSLQLKQLPVPWLSITLIGELQGPIACGDRWVRLAPRPDALARVVLSSQPWGEGDVVHDPDTAPAAEQYVHSYHPSPDGRYIALALAPGYDTEDPTTWGRGATFSPDAQGEGTVAIGIYDVDAERLLPGRLVAPTHLSPVWDADSAGFWAIGRGLHDGAETLGAVHWPVGHSGPATVEQVGFGTLSTSPDGRFVALALPGASERGTVLLREEGEWRAWLDECPRRFQGAFSGDGFIARWFGDTPLGRIVRIPLGGAEDRTRWHELIPAQKKPAHWMNVVGETIVVGYQDDTDVEMRLFDLDGAPRGEVPLRGGSIPRTYGGDYDGVDPCPGGFSFLYDGFTIAPEFHVYRLVDGELETHRIPGADLGPLEHTRYEAESDDGTRIPFHVIRRPESDASTPRPAILSAYGNLSLVRTDPPTLYLPFLDAGGIYVWANVRGGGEFGLDWHAQGSGLNKGQPSKDLIAVAERLVEMGLTAKKRIGLSYNSGGGILTAIALTRRPDLWGAVIPVGGLTDFLTHGSLFPAPDWPVATDSRIAKSNLEWSPLQNVRKGEEYPPTLLVSFAPEIGWTGQYRKFVATLRHATSSDAPILYRRVHGYWHWDFSPQDGHNGPDSGVVQTDRLAFFMLHLGLDPVEGRPSPTDHHTSERQGAS